MRPVPATPTRAATICAAAVPIEACDAAKAAEPTGLLLTPTLPTVFDPAGSAGSASTLALTPCTLPDGAAPHPVAAPSVAPPICV